MKKTKGTRFTKKHLNALLSKLIKFADGHQISYLRVYHNDEVDYWTATVDYIVEEEDGDNRKGYISEE